MCNAEGSAILKYAKLYVDGEWVEGTGTYPVYDKFSGQLIGYGSCASRELVDRAIGAAGRSFAASPLDPAARAEILMNATVILEQRREEIAQTIIAEAGFPMIDALNEVTRAIQTFTLSAEEGKRLAGHGVPIEATPGNSHRMAF